MEWISVEDRLPELREDVVTYRTGDGMNFHAAVMYRIDKYPLWSDHFDVTHWMPLPKPPQESE